MSESATAASDAVMNIYENNTGLRTDGTPRYEDFNQEGNSLQFEKMDDADKLMKELKKKFKFKVYEREEVVKEGTWHIAKNYSQLKRAMKKPMKKILLFTLSSFSANLNTTIS